MNRKLCAILALLCLLAVPAEAAYRSSTVVNNTSSTTPHGDKPAGLTVNDYLACALNFDGTTSITPPSGFTSRAGGFQASPDGQTTQYFDKIADAGDVAASSYTFTLGASSDPIIICFALSGRDTTSPRTFITSTANTTSNATPVTTSGSSGTAAASDDVVFICGLDSTASGAVWGNTAPASFTERQDSNNAVFNTLTLDTLDASAGGALGTIGGTATRSGGSGNAGFTTIIASIKVAAAGGTVCNPLNGRCGTGAPPIVSLMRERPEVPLFTRYAANLRRSSGQLTIGQHLRALQ